MKVRTRDGSSPQGKPGIWFCCHPEELEQYLEPMAGALLKGWDCALWYEDGDAAPEGERREKLGEMRLFLAPVTEKLLAAPNAAMDEWIPFAREKRIPILPILMERGLEWYFMWQFGQAAICLDPIQEDGETVREKGERFLNAALSDETWNRLLKGECREDPEDWGKLAELYDMGIGVERDPAAALKLREKEARSRRAILAEHLENLKETKQLRSTLERIEELQDQLDYPYDREKDYRRTLTELEKVCRRGAEHFKDREEKRRLRRCLTVLGLEHKARGDGEKSVRHLRSALKTARELAAETGELSDRLWEGSCHRNLGDEFRVEENMEAWEKEYESALELDQKLWEETGEVSVLESLADDYWGLGQSRNIEKDRKKQRENWEKQRKYREKRLEILLLLAEKTGKRWIRQESCMARARLAAASEEEKAEKQLDLAEEGFLTIARETDRRADWLMLVELYHIRMDMAWEDKEIRKWYDKAEEILEKLSKRRIPEEVYSAWLSICADALESMEEDDDELEEKVEVLRKLRGESLQNRSHSN